MVRFCHSHSAGEGESALLNPTRLKSCAGPCLIHQAQHVTVAGTGRWLDSWISM